MLVAASVNNFVYRVHNFALNAKQELCMQYIRMPTLHAAALDHLKLTHV